MNGSLTDEQWVYLTKHFTVDEHAHGLALACRQCPDTFHYSAAATGHRIMDDAAAHVRTCPGIARRAVEEIAEAQRLLAEEEATLTSTTVDDLSDDEVAEFLGERIP